MKSCPILLLAVLVFPIGMLAKRLPPKPVSPVVYNGVEYSAQGDGRAASVVATDVATRKQLWTVEVFRTRINPLLEEDVQWVFISDLRMVGGALLVKDEKSRCYRLDLATKRIRKDRCLAF